MQEERRRFSRVRFDVTARLLAGGRDYQAGGIRNLGIGGCLLSLQAPEPPGTACRVLIGLEGVNDRVEIRGHVVRNTGDSVAVKFTAIDPDSLVHLRNIIRYNASDPDAIEEELREHPGLL